MSWNSPPGTRSSDKLPAPQGLTVYKKLRFNLIAELIIPADVQTNLERKVTDKRYAKYRCERAYVNKIYAAYTKVNSDNGWSIYGTSYTQTTTSYMTYVVGQYVTANGYNSNIDMVCSNGIHFYTTEAGAIAHNQTNMDGKWVKYEYDDDGGLFKEWEMNGSVNHGRHYTREVEYDGAVIEKIINYVNGVIHGRHEIIRNKVLIKECNYVDDSINGYVRYYAYVPRWVIVDLPDSGMKQMLETQSRADTPNSTDTEETDSTDDLVTPDATSANTGVVGANMNDADTIDANTGDTGADVYSCVNKYQYINRLRNGHSYYLDTDREKVGVRRKNKRGKFIHRQSVVIIKELVYIHWADDKITAVQVFRPKIDDVSAQNKIYQLECVIDIKVRYKEHDKYVLESDKNTKGAHLLIEYPRSLIWLKDPVTSFVHHVKNQSHGVRWVSKN